MVGGSVEAKSPFYHDGMRELQDRFDGRRVADQLAEHRRRYDFWDADRELIETTPFFFIATSFGDFTDCSLRSGMPGFVKNPNVGLLFVKFDGATLRVRINGKASLLDSPADLARHHGAKMVVRVVCEIYSNCPRSVHDLSTGTLSKYLPHPGYVPPPPEWKSRDYIRDILPATDPHASGIHDKKERSE